MKNQIEEDCTSTFPIENGSVLVCFCSYIQDKRFYFTHLAAGAACKWCIDCGHATAEAERGGEST